MSTGPDLFVYKKGKREIALTEARTFKLQAVEVEKMRKHVISHKRADPYL